MLPKLIGHDKGIRLLQCNQMDGGCKVKILFCGTYMPPALIPRFRYASEAANHFCGNLLKELRHGNDVQVLSFYGFPKEGDWSNEVEKEISEQGIDFVVKTGTISRITGFFRYQWKLFRLLRDMDYVLLYNYYWIHYGILGLARFFGVRTALIVADHSGPESHTSLVRRILARWTERDYRRFDALIFLSHHFYEQFPHPHKLFFPGAVCMADYAGFRYRKKEKCQFLYSGLLNEVTGIDLYLKAIRLVNMPNVEFVFTGRGPLEKAVREAAQQDARIVYHGFVSREEYYGLLAGADIVVNPRNMALPENKNNFPSKVMEYLASGNIVISTRFAGWEDFAPYILFVETSVEALCGGLQEAYGKRREGLRYGKSCICRAV